MNLFEQELVKWLGARRLRKIQNTKVGIAGAGGLGSNCAFNLVRVGFKQFTLVDFDRVDISNLNRQFFFWDQIGRLKVEALKENLLRINPDLEIIIDTRRIDENNVGEFFSSCPVVVEALDKPEAKRIISEHYAAAAELLVGASGLAGWADSDAIRTHRIRSNWFLVCDLTSEVGENLPPLSPRVNVTAAKQANIILEWVLKEDENGSFPDFRY